MTDRKFEPDCLDNVTEIIGTLIDYTEQSKLSWWIINSTQFNNTYVANSGNLQFRLDQTVTSDKLSMFRDTDKVIYVAANRSNLAPLFKAVEKYIARDAVRALREATNDFETTIADKEK